MGEAAKLVTRQEALWQRYIDARQHAERTGNFADALAAGRAMRDFYVSFVPEIMAIDASPPVQFPGRAKK